MEEKIEKTITILKADNVALMEENTSLKRQLGGLKTSNANYRRQVERLKQQLSHYKDVDVEGDELYEKKSAECDDLRKRLNTAEITIVELREQISSYNTQVVDYQKEIAGLQGEIENLHEIIRYEKTPWWKKLLRR